MRTARDSTPFHSSTSSRRGSSKHRSGCGSREAHPHSPELDALGQQQRDQVGVCHALGVEGGGGPKLLQLLLGI